MEEEQGNDRNPFTPVEEEVEEEFSEEDEQDSSSTGSESEEWPNTAAEQNGLKVSRTTSKVELSCSKQMIPSATSRHLTWNINELWHIRNTEYPAYISHLE